MAKEISEDLAQKEKWYGMEYDFSPFNANFLEVGRHLLIIDLEVIRTIPHIPELRMPDPNPFIPENLAVDRKEIENVSTRKFPR
jgi:secreted Zn-dependent insulinase-like peptidase